MSPGATITCAPLHSDFTIALRPGVIAYSKSCSHIASAPWNRGDTVDGLRRQVATIEALMFACDAPPILITLVEDLYQSIDRLGDHRCPRSSLDPRQSLLDAG